MAKYYTLENNIVTNTLISDSDPLDLGVNTFLNTSSLNIGDKVANDGTITKKFKCSVNTSFISGSIQPTLTIKCNRNINTIDSNIFSTSTGSIDSVTSGDDNIVVVVDTLYTGSTPITITLSDSIITATDGDTYDIESTHDVEVL